MLRTNLSLFSVYKISDMLPEVSFAVSSDKTLEVVFYNHSKLTSIGH